MRIYSASSEETLRARHLLSDWVAEGLVTSEQHQRLQQETVSDLRTTNIFLRIVLFFFTVIGVGAAAALFFVVFLSRPPERTIGVFLLIFAALCYAAAEVAASKARLHRHGIEEALAVCAVWFLCSGMQATLFGGIFYSSKANAVQSLVPAAGALFSLWIWHRFGLWYAFLAAMTFAMFLPGFWTTSHAAQHVIVAAFYAVGLVGIVSLRSRHHFDYLDSEYSLAEGLLWLGLYLAINLKISSLGLDRHWWEGGAVFGRDFATLFYWTTWILTWCLPPVVLLRGIRRKDRPVIAVGAFVLVLTFVTNKPYLGWTRHTWDPMLLGILLIGAALMIRRWLSRGPNGVRRGFTAERLSARDKRWMNAVSPVLGLVSPPSVTPQPSNQDFDFGGGSSGGGGASGGF